MRGEYTKTKVDRIIFLTEVTQQLKSLLDYKYRTRRVCHQDKQKGKTITEFRTPNKKDTDLVFAVYHDKKMPYPNSLYEDPSRSFALANADSSNTNRLIFAFFAFGGNTGQWSEIIVMYYTD
ncbi:MAG: hypothetical protein WA667_20185 [Candidatus Nitrosopolaris sp.]